MNTKNGYDKLEWGAKVEEVVRKYGKFNGRMNFGLAGEQDNAKEYYQHEPEEYIRKRTFTFQNGELQMVTLYIKDFAVEIQRMMENTFGKFVKEEKCVHDTMPIEDISHIKRISPDLEIRYSIVPGFPGSITISYNNPKWIESWRKNSDFEKRLAIVSKMSL